MAFILASYLKRLTRGHKDTILCGGQYVTKLGKVLGFKSPGFDFCTQLSQGMCLLDGTLFKMSTIVEKVTFPYFENRLKWVEPKDDVGQSSRQAEIVGGNAKVREEVHVEERVGEPLPEFQDIPSGDTSNPMDDLISRMDTMNANFTYMGNQFREWRDEYHEWYNSLSSRISSVQDDVGRLHDRMDYHDYLMDTQYQHQHISYSGCDGTYHPYGDPPGYEKMDVDTNVQHASSSWQSQPWNPDERVTTQQQFEEDQPSDAWDRFFGRG